MSGPQTQHKGVVYLLTYCTSQAHALSRAGLLAVMVGPTDRPHPHPGPKPSSAPTRARARARAPTSTRARPTTTATRSRTSSAWRGGCERRARRRGAPTWARGWTAFARFSSRKKRRAEFGSVRVFPPRNCIRAAKARAASPSVHDEVPALLHVGAQGLGGRASSDRPREESAALRRSAHEDCVSGGGAAAAYWASGAAAAYWACSAAAARWACSTAAARRPGRP